MSEESERAFEQGGYVKTELLRGPLKDKPISQTTTYYGCPEGKDNSSVNARPSELAVSSIDRDIGNVSANTGANPVKSIKAAISRAIVNFIRPNNKSHVNYYDDELSVSYGTTIDSSQLNNTQNGKNHVDNNNPFTSESNLPIIPKTTIDTSRLHKQPVTDQQLDAQNKKVLTYNENDLTYRRLDSQESSDEGSQDGNQIVPTERDGADTVAVAVANQATVTEVDLNKLKEEYTTALENIKNDANVGVHNIDQTLGDINKLYDNFLEAIQNINSRNQLIEFAKKGKDDTEQSLYQKIANDIKKFIKEKPSEQIVDMVCANQMIDIKNNPDNLDGEKYHLPELSAKLILKKIECTITMKSNDLCNASKNLTLKEKLDFFKSQSEFIINGVYVQTPDKYNLLKDGEIIVKKIHSDLKNTIELKITTFTKQLNEETKKEELQTDLNTIVKTDDNENSSSLDEIPENLDSNAYNSDENKEEKNDENEEEKNDENKEKMFADLNTLKTRPPNRRRIRPGRQIATINQALSDAINKKIIDILNKNVPKEKSIVPLEQKSMGDIKQLLSLRIEDYISKFELFKIIEEFLNGNYVFDESDKVNSKDIMNRTRDGILALIPILQNTNLISEAKAKFEQNLLQITRLFESDFRYVLAIPFTDKNILNYITNITLEFKHRNKISPETSDSDIMRDYIRFSFVPFQLIDKEDSKEYTTFVDAYTYEITEQTNALAVMVKNIINDKINFQNFHLFLKGFSNKNNTGDVVQEEDGVVKEKDITELIAYFSFIYGKKIIHIGELISIYNFFKERSGQNRNDSNNFINRIVCALYFWDLDMNMTNNIFYKNMNNENIEQFKDTIKKAGGGTYKLQNSDDTLVKYNQKLNNARIMTFLKINKYAGNYNHNVYRPIVRNGNELLLGFRNVMNNVKKEWKYFSLGRFNKIYLPSNSTEEKPNREIVVGKHTKTDEKSKEPMYKCVNLVESGKDVFIIGYGSSGSGKTSTLIYNTTTKEEGATVALCEEVCAIFNSSVQTENQSIEDENEKTPIMISIQNNKTVQPISQKLAYLKTKLEKYKNKEEQYNHIVSCYNRQIKRYNEDEEKSIQVNQKNVPNATSSTREKSTHEKNDDVTVYNTEITKHNKSKKKKKLKKIKYKHYGINVVKMTVFEIKGKISNANKRFRRVLYFDAKIDTNTQRYNLRLRPFQTVVSQFDKPKIKSSKDDDQLGSYLKHFITDDRLIHATMNNPESSRSHVICTLTFCNKQTDHYLFDNNKQIIPIENLGKIIVGDFAGVENKFDETNESTFMKFYDKLAVSTYDNNFKLPEKESDCGKTDINTINMLNPLFKTLKERNKSNSNDTEGNIVPALRLNRKDSKQFKQNKFDDETTILNELFNDKLNDTNISSTAKNSLEKFTGIDEVKNPSQKTSITIDSFQDTSATKIADMLTADLKFKEAYNTASGVVLNDYIKNNDRDKLFELIASIVNKFCGEAFRKVVKTKLVDAAKNYTNISYQKFRIRSTEGEINAIIGEEEFRNGEVKSIPDRQKGTIVNLYNVSSMGLDILKDKDKNNLLSHDEISNNEKRKSIFKLAGVVLDNLMEEWVNTFNEERNKEIKSFREHSETKESIEKVENRLSMENTIYFNAHAFFGYLYHKLRYEPKDDDSIKTALLEDKSFDKLFSSGLVHDIREHEEVNLQRYLREKKAEYLDKNKNKNSPYPKEEIEKETKKFKEDQIDGRIRYVLEREMKPVVDLLNDIEWKINKLPIPRAPSYIKQKATAIVKSGKQRKQQEQREQEINHLEYLYDFIHDVQRISQHIIDRRTEGEFINAELANIRKDLIQCMLIKSKNHIFTAPNMDTTCTSTFCKKNDVCFTIKKTKRNNGGKPIIESETFKYLKIMNRKKNEKMQELRTRRLKKEETIQKKIDAILEKIEKSNKSPKDDDDVFKVTNYSEYEYNDDDYNEDDYNDNELSAAKKNNDLIYNFYDNLQVSIFTVFNMNDTTDNPPNITYIDNYNDKETTDSAVTTPRTQTANANYFSVDPFLFDSDNKSIDVQILYDNINKSLKSNDFENNDMSFEKYTTVVGMLDKHNATTTLGTLIFTDNMAKFGNEPAPDMRRTCGIQENDWMKSLNGKINGPESEIKTVPPENSAQKLFKSKNDVSPPVQTTDTKKEVASYNNYKERGANIPISDYDTDFYSIIGLNRWMSNFLQDKKTSNPKRPYHFYKYDK